MVYGDGIFLIVRHCARDLNTQTSQNLRILSKLQYFSYENQQNVYFLISAQACFTKILLSLNLSDITSRPLLVDC
jgi:hypothetical protein